MNRAAGYLGHMLETAQLASSCIDGMKMDDFLADVGDLDSRLAQCRAQPYAGMRLFD